jgi:hypothetical protein
MQISSASIAAARWSTGASERLVADPKPGRLERQRPSGQLTRSWDRWKLGRHD